MAVSAGVTHYGARGGECTAHTAALLRLATAEARNTERRISGTRPRRPIPCARGVLARHTDATLGSRTPMRPRGTRSHGVRPDRTDRVPSSSVYRRRHGRVCARALARETARLHVCAPRDDYVLD